VYAEAVNELGPVYPPEAYVEHMRIPCGHLPRCRAIAQDLIERHSLPLRLALLDSTR